MSSPAEKPSHLQPNHGMDNPAEYAQKAPDPVKLGEFIVNSLGPVQKDKRVIDIGCGDGTLTLALQNAGWNIVGTDINPAMVESAKLKGVPAICCKASELHKKFPAGSVDIVVSNAVFHWISREEMPKTLETIATILKPGGKFIAAFGGVGDMEKALGALQTAFHDYNIPYKSPWEEHPGLALQIEGINGGFMYESDGAKLAPSPQHLPQGIKGWYHTFAKYFNASLTDEQLDKVSAHAEAIYVQQLKRDPSSVDYVRNYLVLSKPHLMLGPGVG
jgi:SAM-dependent methyltransferase